MKKCTFITVHANGQSVTLRISDAEWFNSLSPREQALYALRKMGYNTSRLQPKSSALTATAA